jgi:pSer/pThr/pTyr-binding forkhead associated (FHA) protein
MNRFDPAHESAPRFALRLVNPPSAGSLPRDFTPLQLVLLPAHTPIELNQPDVLVGRHSQCDLRLPSPEVSRCHCRLQFQEGHWWVKDSQSTNGVFVNNHRVESVALRSGDVIRIGNFTLVVHQLDTLGSAQADQFVVRSIATALTQPQPQRRAS